MILVVPLTLPVITNVSLADWSGAKFTSRVTNPPPSKLPVTVKASSVSESSPTLSVPATRRLPAVRPCVPVPNAIVDWAPMVTVSQPATAPESVAATPLKSRVWLIAPSPPVSARTPSRLAPGEKVRLVESSASLMSPLSVAPLSTTMLSQPSRPSP